MKKGSPGSSLFQRLNSAFQRNFSSVPFWSSFGNFIETLPSFQIPESLDFPILDQGSSANCLAFAWFHYLAYWDRYCQVLVRENDLLNPEFVGSLSNDAIELGGPAGGYIGSMPNIVPDLLKDRGFLKGYGVFSWGGNPQSPLEEVFLYLESGRPLVVICNWFDSRFFEVDDSGYLLSAPQTNRHAMVLLPQSKRGKFVAFLNSQFLDIEKQSVFRVPISTGILSKFPNFPRDFAPEIYRGIPNPSI